MRGRSYLLIGLAGAAALAALARTQRGQVVAADVVGAVVNAVTPRGIRNNNPGNIEYIPVPARAWRGQVGKDGRFGIYDTAANGVRAIGGELKASIRKGQTIEQAIFEWAPPSENDTGAYVDAVVAEIGAHRADRLTIAMLPAAARGIIKHENGTQPYNPADVAAWVNS